jgi:hypothetical protein
VPAVRCRWCEANEPDTDVAEMVADSNGGRSARDVKKVPWLPSALHSEDRKPTDTPSMVAETVDDSRRGSSGALSASGTLPNAPASALG